MDTSGTSPDERRPGRVATAVLGEFSRCIIPRSVVEGSPPRIEHSQHSSLDDPGLCSDRLWPFAVGIYIPLLR